MGGDEAISQNPVISDRVSWVVEVGYVWGKVNELTRSQITRPIRACFPFSGEEGDMGGNETEHHKPGHLDRVFWVIEVEYV